MTTKLIKRDTNWEVYQNGSLVASTFNTDLPTITFSDEVAKELGIVDISKKAIEYCKKRFNNQDWEEHYYTYVDSYNQFLSDNADKRFTLEDIAVAFEAGRTFEVSKHESANQIEYIQSLTKEEYFCELEMETVVDKKAREEAIRNRKDGENAWIIEYIKQPKITNNSVTIKKIWK